MKSVIMNTLGITFGFIGFIWVASKGIHILLCLLDKRIIR